MGFFPELKEKEETTTRDLPSVLFATQDGWIIEEDIEILERLEKYKLSNKTYEEIYDFISQGDAGAFLTTDVGIIVILNTAVPKSN